MISSGSVYEFSESGQSVDSRTVSEMVKSKLKTLLGTNHYDIAGDPDYGANLSVLRHLPNTPAKKEAAELNIKSAVAQYMNYVSILGVELISADEIIVRYSYIDSNEDMLNLVLGG